MTSSANWRPGTMWVTCRLGLPRSVGRLAGLALTVSVVCAAAVTVVSGCSSATKSHTVGRPNDTDFASPGVADPPLKSSGIRVVPNGRHGASIGDALDRQDIAGESLSVGVARMKRTVNLPVAATVGAVHKAVTDDAARLGW